VDVKAKTAHLNAVQICQALGDPIRFAIVQKLHSEGPTACGAFGFDCPPATLSHHFNVLRSVGLVHTQRAGNRRINVLRREEIEAEFPGLLRSLLGRKPSAARRMRTALG
jgi:predicted transcriptional regulator